MQTIRLTPLRSAAAALMLIAASLACNTILGGSPGTSQPQEVKIRKDITFGPGPFNYGDPTTGLADLSSYTATLTISFDGTRDGNADKWSANYKMSSIKDPAAKLWTIDKVDNGTALDTVVQAELGGLDFEKDGQDFCRTTVSQPADLLSSRLELASFLSGLIGAEPAGTEEVNKIAATHYTFDQRALGEDGISESQGDIWIAAEGNYVVKYVLSTKAGEKYFGRGVDGVLTMDYELGDPNVAVEIKLPEDCPPGLVGTPTMPDARDLENAPGMQVYTSSSSVADVAAFYVKEAPALGWQQDGDVAIQDTVGNVSFTQGDQVMIVSIEAGSGDTTVTVIVAPNQSSDTFTTP